MKLAGFCLDGVQQRLPKPIALYVVGGAVRDEIVGKTPDDRDWVVVGATPQCMLDAGFVPVGSGFPVFLHPVTHEEYALARTERKQGVGYKGFTFHAEPSVTLEEDLVRRDFTINAMAKNAQGVLIDPYKGASDLQQRVLRHVGPAFVEDPLRVLRLARFLARWPYFNVHPDTWALCQQIAKQGELAHLVPERVLTELQRAMREVAPSRAWELLAQLRFWSGLLKESSPAVWDGLACGHNAIDWAGLDALQLEDHRWLWCLGLLPDEASLNEVQRRLKLPTQLYQLACVLMRCRTFVGQVVCELDVHQDGEVLLSALLAVLHAVDVFRKPERLQTVLTFLSDVTVSPYQQFVLRILQNAACCVQHGEYHHELRLCLQTQGQEGSSANFAQAVQVFKQQWVANIIATAQGIK